MTVKSYSPKNVVCTANASIIQAFNNVDVDLDEERWKFSAATTGQVTRTRNESRLGTITFTFPQTTSDNEVLDNMTTEHDSTTLGNPPAFVKIQIKDNWGKSLHTMPQATLVKKPKAEYGDDVTDREWQFKGEIIDHTVGGN